MFNFHGYISIYGGGGTIRINYRVDHVLDAYIYIYIYIYRVKIP
jgi:hypothetical protein